MGKNSAEERSQTEEERESALEADFEQSAKYLLHVWPVEMAQVGDAVRGFSLSQKPDGWLLVIRAKVDGIQQVAFLFSETTRGCVVLAALKAKNGALNWRDDQYS